ncbi:MAG: hypothetical protein KGI66_03500 [Patescibacteria group bacterium]|nr:hypothetical protein [Patescibacteria group bacterium]
MARLTPFGTSLGAGYDVNAPAVPQSFYQIPGLYSGGNPYASGYAGYAGYGPSPYSFSYGPYGWGSYGYQPGVTGRGFENPPMQSFFDNVGKIMQGMNR